MSTTKSNRNTLKCRTCLAENIRLWSILDEAFAVDDGGLRKNLCQMLSECNRYPIKDFDRLPQTICLSCIESAQKAFLFRRQVELSQEALLEQLSADTKAKADSISYTCMNVLSQISSDGMMKTALAKAEALAPKCLKIKQEQLNDSGYIANEAELISAADSIGINEEFLEIEMKFEISDNDFLEQTISQTSMHIPLRNCDMLKVWVEKKRKAPAISRWILENFENHFAKNELPELRERVRRFSRFAIAQSLPGVKEIWPTWLQLECSIFAPFEDRPKINKNKIKISKIANEILWLKKTQPKLCSNSKLRPRESLKGSTIRGTI